MKRKFYLLLTLTLFYSGSSLGQTFNKQNSYLDALELANIRNSLPKFNKDTNYTVNSFADAFKKIVHKYGNDAALLANPFLKDYLLFIYPPDSSIQVSKNIIGGDGQKENKVTKSIGYFSEKLAPASLTSASWQASAINGVANFMAGRFKQEVSHVAINQIFKRIKTEDAVLINSVFPKTFKQIGTLYGSGSYYTADLLLLRQTAQIDIENLPRNIIRNSETIFPNLKDPKLKDMLSLGGYLFEYSQQGQSLDRLLSTFANETYSSDSTVYKILNLADLISQALLNSEGSKDIWVNPRNLSPTALSSLKNMEVRYFYGLLYQQLIQIPEFKTYLNRQSSGDIVSIATKIQDLISFVNKLNNTYNYIKTKDFDLKTPEEIIIYIKDINQSLSTFNAALKNIPEIKLNDTLVDVSSKYITIVEAIMVKDYQKAIPLLIIDFGDYMGNNAKSSRTIAFVSQLATMESADDMEALLSAYSLPIGSSSIKRQSSFNISVNSYVGITGGWEKAYGSLKNQTKGNVGLSALVGISATFLNGYLTPFVSFIDLGSIVNQRLNNDTTAYTNLKLEHFFTPGIGLFVNCPGLPITAGIHYSYIPNLRTIKYESGTSTITESNRSVSRINFSILVDIPFFTFYNKGRSR